MSEEKRTVEEIQRREACDGRRREFLRTSIHAAYATPIIMSVLVERASAQSSVKNPNCSNREWACAHLNVCGVPPGGCEPGPTVYNPFETKK